ncbi:MAG: hypothetical protein ABL865_02325 [Candidatus Nitrotoga sp.]
MASITQRKNKLLIRLTLAAVLFAQGVIAANACVLPSMNPTQAFVKQAATKQPCNQHVTTTSSLSEQDPTAQKIAVQMNNNVCLASCTQTDQINVDHHNVTVAHVSTTNFLPATLPVQCMASTFIPSYQVLNTGPPVAIRFCTFLI